MIFAGLRSLPLDGSRKAKPYLENDFDKTQATLSPDTRYLAYASNETGGNYDVLLQTFPDPSNGKVRIAANGCCPRWNGDGTELFYVDMAGHIVTVPVKTTPRFQSGRPVVLDVSTSSINLGRFDGSFFYDVSPDGQRFLLDGQPAAASTRVSPVTVFLNWPAALKH